MRPLTDLQEAGPRFCSDRRSNRDRSRRAASRLRAGNSLRSAHCTAHRKIAGRASCHSPVRISCGASQCEAEHGIGWMEDIRRWRAEVIPAIGVVPVPLYLFRWNGNVLSVFSAFCVDVAIDVLDFSRVAVRIIATAGGRIVGHAPFRIELLVQELILRGMVVKPSLVLLVLCLDWRRQQATKTAPKKEFA